MPDTELTWGKSSHSLSNNCVEVAKTARVVHVRDSKDEGRGKLAASPAAWSTFIASTRA
ncbi:MULTISPECIES: DUF397 domain-containing protein [Streptomyces]|uniref:DUF397 domain-containing protein n=1 Tax=Streptomyces TaxID=1883 RepID=UPI000B2AA7D8